MSYFRLLVAETKFQHGLAARDFAADMGGRIYYRDAPPTLHDDESRASQQHGIAVIVHDRDISVVQIDEMKKG